MKPEQENTFTVTAPAATLQADRASHLPCRTLADEVDDLAKVSFKLPPDAVKPAAEAQGAQAARAQESPAQHEGSAAAGKWPPSGPARNCPQTWGGGTTADPGSWLYTLQRARHKLAQLQTCSSSDHPRKCVAHCSLSLLLGCPTVSVSSEPAERICAAGPAEARAQDADRAALAGTGLEGLFDPAPSGRACPSPPT